MSRRLQAMYKRAFEAAFLKFTMWGASEGEAIELAEREAQEGLDRYCDEEMDERRLNR